MSYVDDRMERHLVKVKEAIGLLNEIMEDDIDIERIDRIDYFFELIRDARIELDGIYDRFTEGE
jgi:hypothetical protein